MQVVVGSCKVMLSVILPGEKKLVENEKKNSIKNMVAINHEKSMKIM